MSEEAEVPVAPKELSVDEVWIEIYTDTLTQTHHSYALLVVVSGFYHYSDAETSFGTTREPAYEVPNSSYQDYTHSNTYKDRDSISQQCSQYHQD